MRGKKTFIFAETSRHSKMRSFRTRGDNTEYKQMQCVRILIIKSTFLQKLERATSKNCKTS